MKQSPIVLIGCGRIGFLLEDDPAAEQALHPFRRPHRRRTDIHCACDIDNDRLSGFARLCGIRETSLYTTTATPARKNPPW